MKVTFDIDDRIVNGARSVVTKPRLMVLFGLAFFGTAVVYAGPAIPNQFQPNTVISSGDVNANFQVLADAIHWSEDNGGINYDGSVGIGTDDPTAPLDVTANPTGGRFIELDRTAFPSIGTTFAMGVGEAGSTDFMFVGRHGVQNDLIITQDGRVGIGAMPAATFDVNGTIAVSGNVVHTSDARLKTNIDEISGALDKVGELRGVVYDWKDDARGDGQQMGLLAQDVEKVAPQAVRDLAGTKTVAYSQLTGLTVEAIKELEARNAALNARIEALEKLAAER
jgi:hypothetical protein